MLPGPTDKRIQGHLVSPERGDGWLGRVLVIVGTRPEAIKMAPVVRCLQDRSELDVKVCATAQHREMLDQVLDVFGIKPEFDLNVMTPSQKLSSMASSVLDGLEPVIERYEPNLVLVHGDTSTTVTGALAAYYHQVPVGHVEAGLRSGNMLAPWPEEGNRRATTALTRLHFAPTERARLNLIQEAVDPRHITVTGNTVIDALMTIQARLAADPALHQSVKDAFPMLREDARVVLITGHRRENFGEGLRQICAAIRQLAQEFEDVDFVYPVHLNPAVSVPVKKALGRVPNIHLMDPLDYVPFVFLMSRSHLILTDSGGIQEEAPALRTPVLVMRNVTERPEGISAGTLRLVGTDPELIVGTARTLIRDPDEHAKMAEAENPYGDGRASLRIVKRIAEFLVG